MKDQSIRESVIKKLPINDEKRDVLHRRLNKLKRDPKGFFQSSYKKRIEQIVSKTPIKHRGSNNFTVISAVYNVEKYLDDYFKSLVNQSLSFKRHIQLILVDDGSTDSSASIIKKWQEKYPKNITYLYKENGGQASARNLGMQYVDTDWVTFIDPDDFINGQYFKVIDNTLVSNQDVYAVGCSLELYLENGRIIKNTHPLKYKFNSKNRKHLISDLDKNIQMSASSTIFKVNESITKGYCHFNEKIKPNFEDAKFIADYFLYNYDKKIIFSENAKYYYRKREDGSSTLDNSWKKIELFDDVFEFGLIPMLESYSSKLGMIPKNIQWTALYHISWYFGRLINKNHNHSILNKEEETRFLTLLNTVFSFIDTKMILEFDLVGIWFFHKVGMLGAFKGEKPNSQIVYLENIDREKDQLLISYFSYFDVSTSFRIFNEDVIPCYEKTVHYSFANSLFVQEKRFWIPFNKDEGVLTVEIDGKPARIAFQKKHHSSIGINSIIEGFKPSFKYYSNDSWILMDRDVQADDNAEHLYRYIMNNHPEQQIYFALRKESHDWTRLEKEGFNLVEFNTEDFENKLCRSSKIISSHLDTYITNYFGDDYEYSKKIIFLQHGVTKDDLSSWFNTKKNLYCIITATKPEYCSLVEDKGRYKLTEKEVVLTGFPRHDNLIKYNFQNNKIILIMPTWRQSIMGNVSGIGNTRTINESFMNTKYAQSWYHLIHSKKLARLVNDYDYKVIFAPHANIESYLELFDVPDYIEIWQASKATSSMQQIFQKAKLMITDYSSVAFEMGILNKTTLYYQFDRDEVFSGGHIYQPGYFSYVEDGFGPVVTEEDDLLIELEKVLNNNGEPLQPYATRMKNTFAYNDTKNCKRVYEAILNLDYPSTVENTVDNIMQYAQKAITHKAWDLALERIEKALDHSTITTTQIENFIQMKDAVLKNGYQCNPVKLANILWSSNQSKEALEKLQLDDKVELSDDLLRLRVKLALLEDDFLTARDSQKLLLERYKQLCTIEDWYFYTQLITITSRLKK
jgi:glycosyltransferase involved in cell wall biosynthesis/CDP-glycerol glycerophosphotransferase (TagB/SpsB family)